MIDLVEEKVKHFQLLAGAILESESLYPPHPHTLLPIVPFSRKCQLKRRKKWYGQPEPYTSRVGTPRVREEGIGERGL